MTSTQVKKAYRKSNKGPKVSRAEQRRRDAEELQRQKKEWEREQAAVKAKAARDKKATKARDEKEKRKREGVPEPRKGVRPSQARISCFVKREGEGDMKRKWDETRDSAAEESDDTMAEDSGPRPGKRVNVQQEDEFGGDDISDLDLPDLFRQLDQSFSSHESAVNKENAGVTSWSSPRKLIRQNKCVVDNKDEERDLDDSQVLAEMATTQLLTEAAKSFSEEQESEFGTTTNNTTFSDIVLNIPTQSMLPIPKLGESNKERQSPNMPVRKPLQERATNMPPPPRPVAAIKAASSNPSMPDHLLRTKPPSRVPATSAHYGREASKDRHNMPPPPIKSASLLPAPSATQAFLELHMDDFFPSPTQEARELLGNTTDFDLPSNKQVMPELSPDTLRGRGLSPSLLKEEMPYTELICTQDLMSSQEIQEMETPCPPAEKVKQQIVIPLVEQPLEEMFLTQDFDLSSQDLEEIGSPCRLPPLIPSTPKLETVVVPPFSKPNKKSQSTKQPLTTKTKSISSPKSSPRLSPRPLPRPAPRYIAPHTCSTKSIESSKFTSKPPKKRFFVEKEDLPRPNPPIPVPDPLPIPTGRGRFFQEKEDDLLQAAIRQSLAPSQQVVPIIAKKSEKPFKGGLAKGGSTEARNGGKGNEGMGDSGVEVGRMLQRTLSEVTDYGDLDFDLGDLGGELWS